jgi:hypothetical protein
MPQEVLANVDEFINVIVLYERFLNSNVKIS